MGYPKYPSAPARIAASAIASFPFISLNSFSITIIISVCLIYYYHYSHFHNSINNKIENMKKIYLGARFANTNDQLKNADGTLMVYGKATDDSLDIDEQIYEY
jgi:hypothetical protein